MGFIGVVLLGYGRLHLTIASVVPNYVVWGSIGEAFITAICGLGLGTQCANTTYLRLAFQVAG